MKATLALTALFLVVASAHPLYDSTLGQNLVPVLVKVDTTPEQYPTLVLLDLYPSLEEDLQLDQYPVIDQDQELPPHYDEDAVVHERRKRQTTVSGGFNTERLGGGARRDSAKFNIGRTFNKHTVTGGVTYDRTKIPGFGSERNFGANVGYEFKPNKNTAFSIGAQHNRGSAGRSTSFGVGFTHQFGRR
ncbi:uncharacterized protein [Panulirus ornatus]|uniref:uncharacterized protein n=1 Tax=Panulirus ornatus TaxID=150431 RepID=UPI003A89DEFB